jgi:hypothetical protein
MTRPPAEEKLAKFFGQADAGASMRNGMAAGADAGAGLPADQGA